MLAPLELRAFLRKKSTFHIKEYISSFILKMFDFPGIAVVRVWQVRAHQSA